MDVTSIFTIIGVLAAFMFFLHNRLSSDIKALDNRLSKEITDLKKEVTDLKVGLNRIEDRIEFSGKVVYIKPEKNGEEEG